MEDDLHFLKIKDALNNLKMEDALNVLKIEDYPNFSSLSGRGPQYLCEWKTASNT
jgi:hypothetical protein